jgi:hypothetical protein
MFAYTKLMQAMAAAGVVSPSDPYFNLTTLLLNTTATNGAQNNTFLDSSTNNFSITRNGNTTQGTFTPFSQTGWSNKFSSSNNLDYPSSAGYQCNSGDFTLEGWIYFNTAANAVFIQIPVANALYWQYYAGYLDIGNSAGGSVAIAWTPVANTWYHVASVRNGSTVTHYINGAVLGSGTAFTLNATGGLQLGYGGAGSFDGYMSNVRLVKGTAVYTAAFTPPTAPLTAISGTSLLICQSNRFLDNSSASLATTVNGTPSVQAFSPFAPTAAYSTSVVGGSGYFDGTGDYLNTSGANLAVGTGDFTYQFWMYALASNPALFDTRTVNNTTTGFTLLLNSTNFLSVYTSSTILTASTAANLNAWNFVSVVRSSGTLTIYLNGVSVGSTSFTNDLTDSTIVIGRYVVDSGLYLGYMSGFQLLKGTAASGAIPTAPPTNIANTQLLLNYTNAGIFDSTAKNDYETLSTAQVSTAQAKWGTTSMVFNGTSDYIVNPSSALVSAWGTGDFTVEGWYYSNNIIGTPPLWMNSTSNSDGMSGCYVYATGSVAFGKIGVNEIASATGVWSNSQWNHLAVVRSGATVYIYVNGVSVASGVAATYVETTTVKPITLGRNYQTVSAYYNGYIDDFRVTKGYARYPSGTTFTPPTAAFPTQ